MQFQFPMLLGGGSGSSAPYWAGDQSDPSAAGWILAPTGIDGDLDDRATASCDGTDDEVQIQAAMDAATIVYAATGVVQVVLLLPGTFTVHHALTPKSGVCLFGCGPNTILLYGYNPISNAFMAGAVNDFCVRNMTLDFTGAATAYVRFLSCGTGARITLRDLVLVAGNTPVLLDQAGTITNVYFESISCGVACYLVSALVGDVGFAGTFAAVNVSGVIDWATAGYWLNASKATGSTLKVYIYRCTFAGNGGIQVIGASGGTIEGCYTQGVVGDTKHGIYLNACSGMTVQDCKTVDHQGGSVNSCGVRIAGGTGNVLIDHTAIGCFYGIYTSASTNTAINRATCTANADDGIRVDDNATLTDCVCIGNDQNGVCLESTSDGATIIGGTFSGNQQSEAAGRAGISARQTAKNVTISGVTCVKGADGYAHEQDYGLEFETADQTGCVVTDSTLDDSGSVAEILDATEGDLVVSGCTPAEINT